MIFQQFNLLAQRTVLGNICFPMEIAGTPREEAKARARELLKLVGLEEPGKRISGTAFRRPEAEGSHCQGHCHQSKGTPL